METVDCWGLGHQRSLDKRVGLLANGCDADLVLLSGDPFDLPTRVLGVWVNGVRRFDRGGQIAATKEPGNNPKESK